MGRPAVARVGVVGAGWWSTHAHLPALAANPRAEIAAIADPDEANRTRAAGHFGVPADRCVRDLAAMLDAIELDGVVIAVPHALHAPLARAALGRGLPVLLEKPMTIDPAEARELAALARDRGAEIVVGYGWHYNPQVLALRDAIAAGAIGTIEFVGCQYAAIVRHLYRGDAVAPAGGPEGGALTAPDPRTYADPSLSGGGQGQAQTTHIVALLAWLTGLRPTDVMAMTAGGEGLAVDLADAVSLRFAGGALGSIGSTGGLVPGAPETLEIRIHGTGGSVVFDVNAGRAAIHGPGGSVRELEPIPPEATYPERAPADDLVDVIVRGGTSGSPAWVGVLAVEVVDAMYRSARSGRRVPVSASGG